MRSAAHANAPDIAWHAVDCKNILEEIWRALTVVVASVVVILAFEEKFVLVLCPLSVIDASLNVSDVLIIQSYSVILLQIVVNNVAKTIYLFIYCCCFFIYRIKIASIIFIQAKHSLYKRDAENKLNKN